MSPKPRAAPKASRLHPTQSTGNSRRYQRQGSPQGDGEGGLQPSCQIFQPSRIGTSCWSLSSPPCGQDRRARRCVVCVLARIISRLGEHRGGRQRRTRAAALLRSPAVRSRGAATRTRSRTLALYGCQARSGRERPASSDAAGAARPPRRAGTTAAHPPQSLLRRAGVNGRSLEISAATANDRSWPFLAVRVERERGAVVSAT